MESIQKLGWVNKFRKFTDSRILKLPLPKINPDIISVLSLLFSVIFIFYNNLLYQIAVLIIVLLLDWLDGLVARKYNFRKTDAEKEKGWIIDVFIDRLSEGIIFLIYFMPFFLLFIINSGLCLFSFKTKRHIILPLRQALLVYLIIIWLL